MTNLTPETVAQALDRRERRRSSSLAVLSAAPTLATAAQAEWLAEVEWTVGSLVDLHGGNLLAAIVDAEGRAGRARLSEDWRERRLMLDVVPFLTRTLRRQS